MCGEATKFSTTLPPPGAYDQPKIRFGKGHVEFKPLNADNSDENAEDEVKIDSSLQCSAHSTT
jgi:hypothetical protein